MSLYSSLRSLLAVRTIYPNIKVGIRFCNNETQDGEDLEKQKEIDPEKDRTKIIPLETSLKYMESKAYQQTYGEKPVWVMYRRNHKGGFAPRKTRKSCVRKGIISTGNPCPICRDEYLILHQHNTKLLQQFISPHTGQILDAFDTGVCQKKQKELLVAIEKAWDEGTLTFDVPFRKYDYSLYNPEEKTETAGIKV